MEEIAEAKTDVLWMIREAEEREDAFLVGRLLRVKMALDKVKVEHVEQKAA